MCWSFVSMRIIQSLLGSVVLLSISCIKGIKYGKWGKGSNVRFPYLLSASTQPQILKVFSIHPSTLRSHSLPVLEVGEEYGKEDVGRSSMD